MAQSQTRDDPTERPTTAPYILADVSCQLCGEERERVVASIYRVGDRALLFCGRCDADVDHTIEGVSC